MAFSFCPGDPRIVETRLGLEQVGHLTSLSPSESFFPSSLKSMWRTLEGETRVEAEWFLSLLLLGEVRLRMSAMALLGEILRPNKKFSLPIFSLSLFILDMKVSLRSL